MKRIKEPELWKDIEGYEGLYQVSNYGKVKSLARPRRIGMIWCIKKEVLMQQRINPSGYKTVVLHKDGKKKTKLVHRLVAFAFIPNENFFPVINHKDEIKTNNYYKNLEWCTQSYNNMYGTKREKTQKTKRERNSDFKALMKKNLNHSYGAEKPILCLRLDGTFFKRFDSVSNAARFIGDCPSHICACCKGRRKSVRGYKFVYETD